MVISPTGLWNTWRRPDRARSDARSGFAPACPWQQADYEAHLETWNEPYLDWARARVNMETQFFDTSQAREGGPLTVKATGWVVPHPKPRAGRDMVLTRESPSAKKYTVKLDELRASGQRLRKRKSHGR